MIYLSPNYHRMLPMYKDRVGYIASTSGGPWVTGVEAGRPWLLENNAYADKFKEDLWLKIQEDYLPYQDKCIGVVVPDVVFDASATISRFHEYQGKILPGYNKAFVTQDGLTLEMVPWDEFEVLFIGGTTEHKMERSMPFITEAQRRGKWVHVGRINSVKRIEYFWMVDSVDGTEFIYPNSPRRQHKIMKAVSFVNGKKMTGKLI